MNHPSRGAVLCLAATLVVAVVLAEGVAARGGGRGGGGFSRGGGGFSRGGPAARGSFGGHRPARGSYRGNYNARGPAADGSFNQGERQERRQERREERQDRRDTAWEDHEQDAPERLEDWQEYVENHEEHDNYGGYYDEGVVYWTLPCRPNVIAMGGVVYYVCGSEWYIRAYDGGDVVYTPVPNPTGH